MSGRMGSAMVAAAMVAAVAVALVLPAMGGTSVGGQAMHATTQCNAYEARLAYASWQNGHTLRLACSIPNV